MRVFRQLPVILSGISRTEPATFSLGMLERPLPRTHLESNSTTYRVVLSQGVACLGTQSGVRGGVDRTSMTLSSGKLPGCKSLKSRRPFLDEELSSICCLRFRSLKVGPT